ncbi:MFS transporter [Asticcacaulis solisilvae]|uniref:MFS transporter n=1 Tax=Asticcacaulis solisilvae TaxID=1217274 RepID=UPI003FD890C7
MSTSRAPYAWATIVALGGFLFGVDATVISGAIGTVASRFNLADWQIGLVVAAPTLMNIPASLTVSSIADYTGRRPILIVLAALYTISAVWAALAQDVWSLVLARAVGGYAFGSLSLAPIYISEISPAKSRGTLVSINQLNIIFGFSAAYFLNDGLLRLSHSGAPWLSAIHLDTETWRYMLGVSALPAAAWFLLLFRVPESPRFLALRGREGEARKIFARFQGEAETATLLAGLHAGPGAQPPLFQRILRLFSPSLAYVVGVGAMLAVAQQITGIDAVYFYAPTIFEQSGVGTNAAFAQAVLIGLVNIVFTVIAMLLIDRIGRKPLLVAGVIGITLSMAVIGYGFNQARYSLSPADASSVAAETKLPAVTRLAGKAFASDLDFKAAARQTVGESAYKAHEALFLQKATHADARLILLGILGFVASFAVSLGPVMWVMLSEIYPNAVRGVAMAAMSTLNAIVSFGVQFLFPIQLNGMGSAWTFGLYAVFGLGFAVLFLLGLPETRGKSLEALEAELKR